MSREVNAACGGASSPCRHDIISAQVADKAVLPVILSFKERNIKALESNRRPLSHTLTGLLLLFDADFSGFADSY